MIVTKAKKKEIALSLVFGLLPLGIGVGGGIALSKFLKADVTVYIVDAVSIDLDAAKASYEEIKAKDGDYSKMEVDQAIQMAYYLFGEERQRYSIGVGYTIASIVRQDIQAMAIADGERYFEESNSVGLVNLFDRMFMQGETTDTYWGGNTDYGSHPKVTYTNAEYEAMMGRTIDKGLIYIVAPSTMIEDTSASKDPPNGIYKEDYGYRIEVELDPKRGVSNYQKQMQTISDLKYKPDFDFCHLSVQTDQDLNLIRMDTHEKYMATTSSGVGSKAEGRLATIYYHNALPEFGFPEPGSILPAYPAEQ